MESVSGTLRVCTAYLPPLDYFAALVAAGRFSVEESETYRKQTFRNRAWIVTSQGVLGLTVPCVKPAGNRTPAGEVRLDMREKWPRTHWRSIVTAYNKSPYFLYYRDEIESIYSRLPQESGAEGPRLVDFNNAFLDFFIGKMRLPATRVEADAPCPEKFVPPLDFSPKSPLLFAFEPYLQTFPSVAEPGRLSILDLLFNAGPEAALRIASARPLHP